jgi:hypothetical protein
MPDVSLKLPEEMIPIEYVNTKVNMNKCLLPQTIIVISWVQNVH